MLLGLLKVPFFQGKCFFGNGNEKESWRTITRKVMKSLLEVRQVWNLFKRFCRKAKKVKLSPKTLLRGKFSSFKICSNSSIDINVQVHFAYEIVIIKVWIGFRNCLTIASGGVVQIAPSCSLLGCSIFCSGWQSWQWLLFSMISSPKEDWVILSTITGR